MQEGLHERNPRREFNQYTTLRESIAAAAIYTWKDTLNMPKKIAICGAENWDDIEELRSRLYPKQSHSTFFKQKKIVDDLLDAITLYYHTLGDVIQKSIQKLYTENFHFDRLQATSLAVSNQRYSLIR